MNQPVNATNNINHADLAWLVLAIRTAASDTDDVTTSLIAARLTSLLPHQTFGQLEPYLSQLQQLGILETHHKYWQLNSDFLQQLTTTINCGCGYQAQWALTKSLLEHWLGQ
jgi:hypothetical protein